MVAGLRAVVSAADELTYAPDVDSLFRQAVEFARGKLGVERCGISLPEGAYLRGTYGTSLSGETTDERSIQFEPNDQWFASLDALHTQGGQYSTIEGPRHNWDGERLNIINHGWIVLTPIRSAQNLIGVFFNDSAISGAPLDPNMQEILAVFCSLLGNMVERKRAERSLAEERNLLRKVIDNIPDFIYVKDLESRFVLGNLALAQLAGANSPEVLVGKTNSDLFPPELAAHYTADDQTVIDSGQVLRNREETALAPNGDMIWVLTTKMPLRNQQGAVIGMMGISRDISELKRSQIALEQANNELETRIQERIGELEYTNAALQAEMTERRQAEEHLRQSEDHFAKAFHASPNAITIVTLVDSIYIDVNARYLELMGFQRDELIGSSVVRGHPPMSAEDQAHLLAAVAEHATVRDFEVTLITKSGERRACQVSIEQIELDGVPCLLTMIHDITERKHIEKALVEEQTLLRTLIDTLPDYIFIKDTHGHFVMSNKAHALAASVRDPVEFRGKPASEFFPPDLASQYDEDDQVVLKTGKALLNLERMTLDANHHPIHVSTTKVPLRDAQGNIVGVVGISRDITAFKLAQEALKQQERFLRQVIDANPSLIFVKDAEGKFILVNKAHAEMNGLTVEAMLGKRDIDFDIPYEEAESYMQADRQVMASGKPLIIAEEMASSASTGKQHWLRTIKVPLFDEQGQATQVLGVALDITERKQAEVALQESEERYRAVTELISDYAFAFTVNLDHTIQPDWGTVDSFKRLAGYAPEEIGSTLKLYHPDDAAAVREQLDKVIRGEPSDQECRIITKTGEICWIHLRRRPVWDDAHQRVVRFYGVSQNITARKLAEEALQKAHDELEERVHLRTAELSLANQQLIQEIAERQKAQESLAAERNLLRTLIDNLPHAVYVKDTQARFAIANKAVANVLGAQSPEAVIGLIDFDFFPRTPADKFYANDMAVLKTGQPIFNQEEKSFDSDGNPKWILTSKFPLWNSRGEVTGLVGIGLDITERKQVEETLRRAHDELEQRVEERTAELRTANEEVRRFAYIVSHDLRAPLVNIKGFSSELRSALDVVQAVITPHIDCLEDGQEAQFRQALDADVPEALSFISASVERMNNLINAILKLSRLGQRELQIEALDTTNLVQDIIMSMRHQIAEHQTTVVVGDLPTISADRTAIEQIFGNILNNAVLYLAPERPGRIEISAEQLARETVFHVRDNGQGIAESDHEKVFELFRRAGKPMVPGEGMGLAYVKTLVRRHEGRIWFDSEPGVGTTFSFSIPDRLTGEI